MSSPAGSRSPLGTLQPLPPLPAGGAVDPELAPAFDPSRNPQRRSQRDWLVDGGLFVFALLSGLVLVEEASARTTQEWVLALDLLAGGLACLALWWRRRWPVGVALALAVPAAFSDMASGAVLIAVFTVAVHRPRPVIAKVTAVHLVPLLLFLLWLRPDPEVPFLVSFLLVLPLFAAVIAAGMYVRARRQLVESLRERARWVEAEQLLRVEQARQLERTRIAREMHDVLAHRISLLSMHAGALEFRPDAPPEEIAQAASVVRDSAHQALQDLREVIGVLRQGPDGVLSQRPQPTLADLPALVEECRRAGSRIDADYRLPDLAAVPTVVGRSAYRIAQEGLTNARKHAPASAVTVVVDGAAGSGLRLEIRSRRPAGGARPVIPGGGTGLVGLVERATLVGGSLQYGRSPEGDFVLSAEMPWSQ